MRQMVTTHGEGVKTSQSSGMDEPSHFPCVDGYDLSGTFEALLACGHPPVQALEMVTPFAMEPAIAHQAGAVVAEVISRARNEDRLAEVFDVVAGVADMALGFPDAVDRKAFLCGMAAAGLNPFSLAAAAVYRPKGGIGPDDVFLEEVGQVIGVQHDALKAILFTPGGAPKIGQDRDQSLGNMDDTMAERIYRGAVVPSKIWVHQTSPLTTLPGGITCHGCVVGSPTIVSVGSVAAVGDVNIINCVNLVDGPSEIIANRVTLARLPALKRVPDRIGILKDGALFKNPKNAPVYLAMAHLKGVEHLPGFQWIEDRSLPGKPPAKDAREGSVSITDCPRLKRIGPFPSGPMKGDLDLRNNPRLEFLPEGVTRVQGKVSLQKCASLVAMPPDFTCMDLVLRGCASLRHLQQAGAVWWTMDMSGCVAWDGVIPVAMRSWTPKDATSAKIITDRFKEGIHPAHYGAILGLEAQVADLKAQLAARS